MLLYIKNLLPRLRQYSQTLDKTELLVEHPWVLIDDEGNQQKYIFQRDGELIMSLSGKVSIGNWKYLAAAKSILIDRIQDKILLNHDFVDPALMILKMDGNKDMPFVLANENLIPDMDVVKYLESFLDVRLGTNIDTSALENDGFYYIAYNSDKGVITIKQKSQSLICRGDCVYKDNLPATDGKYKLGFMHFIVVKDGLVYNILQL